MFIASKGQMYTWWLYIKIPCVALRTNMVCIYKKKNQHCEFIVYTLYYKHTETYTDIYKGKNKKKGLFGQHFIWGKFAHLLQELPEKIDTTQ